MLLYLAPYDESSLLKNETCKAYVIIGRTRGMEHDSVNKVSYHCLLQATIKNLGADFVTVTSMEINTVSVTFVTQLHQYMPNCNAWIFIYCT
jgi:hypothetical protein